MSANDLARVQEMFACWGTGGFHGPDKETNFDKFVTADAVIDYRFHATIPELKPFDGVFHGKGGFFENMGIHVLFDWQDMKVEFSHGPHNSILIHMDCLPVLRATGKAASERTVCFLQCFMTEGKVSKSVYYFSNTASWEALF